MLKQKKGISSKTCEEQRKCPVKYSTGVNFLVLIIILCSYEI